MLSPIELDERAASAQNFLNDPVVKEIFSELRSQYTGTLMQADVGSLTATTAHAMLRALEDIHAALVSKVNDKKMYDKYRKRDSQWQTE
jgi:hypothetical protein